jgi:hypothetical protein
MRFDHLAITVTLRAPAQPSVSPEAASRPLILDQKRMGETIG